MILKCNAVNFEYEKNIKVLNNFCFEINEKENVGIIGSNGAGKSTLLKLLVGLIFPDSGEILFNYNGEIELNRKNLSAIRKNTGFVFQDADNQLFMSRVEDDIAFGPQNYGITGDQLTQLVNDVMSKLGIMELKGRKNARLSGGEKKLVSIATALALEPKLLIFDEPSIALDPGNRRRLINILKNLNTTKIIATHDLDLVLDVCNRVMILSEGKIIADGKPDEILYNKKLLEQSGLELPLCLQGR